MSKLGCHMPVFEPASEFRAGVSGSVPAPKFGQGARDFLCADGEFRKVFSTSDGTTAIRVSAEDVEMLMDAVIAFDNAVA